MLEVYHLGWDIQKDCYIVRWPSGALIFIRKFVRWRLTNLFVILLCSVVNSYYFECMFMSRYTVKFLPYYFHSQIGVAPQSTISIPNNIIVKSKEWMNRVSKHCCRVCLYHCGITRLKFISIHWYDLIIYLVSYTLFFLRSNQKEHRKQLSR